ncbi:phosphatidylserine decarboxylase [Chlamydia sp.]|uniref:phosphatidylserine decarboxylase n=1 Tax=Chlamydia sp. TaxID=35827 RepID=UPI0025C47EA4|nr:phosphatidylserine decarboxylase [Chlamydia sp.]MBQ8498805.1 phosphatidylserine decarboxylase [Chlamydia sp.]
MAGQEIWYINRETGLLEKEPVLCSSLMQYFLENRIGRAVYACLCKNSWFSRIVGRLQRLGVSRWFIKSFVEKYHLREEEWLLPLHKYTSFNDFFIRKLKLEARPILRDKEICCTPADGAYFVFPSIEEVSTFTIKHRIFSLENFLQDKQLASEYAKGSMVIARLAPFDYHRFHFPVEGVVGESKRINGYLFSVHPLMLKRNLAIFIENKREVTLIDSKEFGKVAYIEVGALNVGSINQTFSSGSFVRRGEEKGFFAFGGSTIVLLFQPQRITFDADLVQHSAQGLETRCRMGESLGKRFSS